MPSYDLFASARKAVATATGVPWRGEGGTWVNFCWVCAACFLRAPTPLSSILWPTIDPILVTFGETHVIFAIPT